MKQKTTVRKPQTKTKRRRTPKMTIATRKRSWQWSRRLFWASRPSGWLWAQFIASSRVTTRTSTKRRALDGGIAYGIICQVMTASWRRAERRMARGIIGWSTQKIYQSSLKETSGVAESLAVPSAVTHWCSEKAHFYITRSRQASPHSLTRRIWDRILQETFPRTCPCPCLMAAPPSVRFRLPSVQGWACYPALMRVEAWVLFHTLSPTRPLR